MHVSSPSAIGHNDVPLKAKQPFISLSKARYWHDDDKTKFSFLVENTSPEEDILLTSIELVNNERISFGHHSQGVDLLLRGNDVGRIMRDGKLVGQGEEIQIEAELCDLHGNSGTFELRHHVELKIYSDSEESLGVNIAGPPASERERDRKTRYSHVGPKYKVTDSAQARS